jgi:hypothetical protein
MCHVPCIPPPPTHTYTPPHTPTRADLYFKGYQTVARGNPNYFTTYGNGKSAARVQAGLRPNGAHRWHSYLKTPK